jgi:DNA (cytosine-5)-methyltransferase 1
MMLRVLDLFSGIGGFSLGLERTGGFKTVAFCEIEPYPRKVLAKHWPEVPCYHDIRELTAEWLAADGIGVDVICGGFPCQDISVAGNGAGLAGERSGLWAEFARLIGELRPRYAIVENVSALLSRGLADVLRDLATLRYDAEWHCIPASAVGAPHRRDRIWIVANRQANAPRPDANCIGSYKPQMHFDGGAEFRHEQISVIGQVGGDVANANGSRFKECGKQWQLAIQFTQDDQWSTEPDVGRMAHGVSSRVDRLKGLGNAVVPQIPELIGRAILADT